MFLRARSPLSVSLCAAPLAWLLATALAAGCSGSESSVGDRRGGLAADGAAGSGGAAAAAPFTCTAGTTLPCDCPDGTRSGHQLCVGGTALAACQGCRTSADAAPGGMAQAPILDGALCPMLAGQAGCTNESFRSEELPASVLFLVDRSGSMRCNLPEAGQSSEECEAMAATKYPDQPTKWQLTTAALEQVMHALVDSGTSAGLSFFTTDDVCGVDSTPSVPVAPVDAAHAAALSSALATTQPNGGTPIVGGTILAYEHLYAEAGLDASGGCAQPPCGARGNRFVVLLTDGADSCPTEPFDGACGGGACTDFLLDHSAPDAVRVNIRTFVIGAPGSETARGFLSELALRGGTAKNAGQCTGERGSGAGDCHFDMTTSTDFASDLSAALDDIRGAALGCEFPVPQPTGAPPTRNVNVQYRPGGSGAPECVGYDDSPCASSSQGFQFAKHADGSDDLTKVVLCGAACDRIRNDPAIQVDVVLGCQPLLLD